MPPKIKVQRYTEPKTPKRELLEEDGARRDPRAWVKAVFERAKEDPRKK
jgi:hypothetical protein